MPVTFGPIRVRRCVKEDFTMSRSTGRRLLLGPLVVLLTVTAQPALALDPPDSLVNPHTGRIETAYVTWDGTHYLVRHTEGRQPPLTTTLETCSGGCDGARIAISPAGDTWVVWWRNAEIDQVAGRKRSASGSWSAVRTLSDPEAASWHPGVAWFDGAARAVFEVEQESGRGVAVCAITDEPEPIGAPEVLGSSTLTSLDAQVIAESGHLWVTWVASTSDVGWSEYQPGSGTWDNASFESYVEDGIETACESIRTEVLGQ
jgi:hypothetical protein